MAELNPNEVHIQMELPFKTLGSNNIKYADRLGDILLTTRLENTKLSQTPQIIKSENTNKSPHETKIEIIPADVTVFFHQGLCKKRMNGKFR